MSQDTASNHYERYVSTFMRILESAKATNKNSQSLVIDDAVKLIGNSMQECQDSGNRIMLVGNGGSAGICSHMATDISKNGGMRATAFNDGAVLTCLGSIST